MIFVTFCTKIYVTVKQSRTHFITKFGWNISQNDKIMLFQPRQPAFLSVRASCRTDSMWTGSLRRLSGPQALEICTHWSITSRVPCQKSIINSSRSIRQLMSWKSLCRPFGKRCHENTEQGRGDLHQVPDCLRGCGCQWWSIRASAVTLPLCKSASSSHHQQTGSLQRHQETTREDNARNAEKWGGCLSWNSISLSFSNKFQPNLVIKCIFDCWTVV